MRSIKPVSPLESVPGLYKRIPTPVPVTTVMLNLPIILLFMSTGICPGHIANGVEHAYLPILNGKKLREAQKDGRILGAAQSTKLMPITT